MSVRARQSDLFEMSAAPEGFRYTPDVLSPETEASLVRGFETLPFAPFQFHGYEGNRRVVSFGWRYDYAAKRVERSNALPDFILALREEAGAFAGRPPETFEQVLVTEYASGAGIGWHRDKPNFGEVVAFSFLAACRLRFRRSIPDGWERDTQHVLPRSAYILSGPARWTWYHSIPAVEQLRYSVTFRTLKTPDVS